VKALDRKLLRDLQRLKGQIASIAAVVACGIVSVIAMRSTLDSMRRSRDAYYERARFPHVFASLKRAPESVAQRIAEIDGVAALETRVVVDALLQVPGLATPATGHIVSVPATGPALLSTVYLRRGRYVSPSADDEALLDEHFADANGLTAGDSVGAVINGRWRRLRIVGVALSPEFIYPAVAGAGMFGDVSHLAILWMNRTALGPLYDMDGAFNDVGVLLGPGGREESVIAALDDLLEPYGGGHAYARKNQPSETVVAGEIEQLRVFGTAMPVIFLAVAAFLLNVVLSRLIATQRKEILMPWPKPDRYEPERYELLLRYVEAHPGISFARLVHLGPIPNGKWDLNASGPFSIDYIGGNKGFVQAGPAERRGGLDPCKRLQPCGDDFQAHRRCHARARPARRTETGSGQAAGGGAGIGFGTIGSGRVRRRHSHLRAAGHCVRRRRLPRRALRRARRGPERRPPGIGDDRGVRDRRTRGRRVPVETPRRRPEENLVDRLRRGRMDIAGGRRA
jgi:hypothetical protein